MAIAISVLRNSPVVNPDSVLLRATPSGNYVLGGDSVNLTPTTWSDPNGEGIIGPALLPPIPPTIDTANAGGYRFEWVPGTNLTNGLLKCYAPGGAELAAGAYPAAALAAYIMLRLLFRGA